MTASLPEAPSAATFASVGGIITDTAQAAIPGAQITLEDTASRSTRTLETDVTGAFLFTTLPPGTYRIQIHAKGFSSWKVKDFPLRPADNLVLPTITLGVESLNTTVSVIPQEDLAELQITAEEHQRILGILPNFYVSYLHSGAAPLTRKQKFKLAFTVSTDPVTLFTTGVTAAIEQAQGDFSGYGSGFPGYATRYAATYGDRLSSTLLGAAVFPSLFHQDPRYFYNGKGTILHRALYAISTTVICKGDNGKWQPNYSNVLGNLSAGLISSTYYPSSDSHSVQVTVDNSLVGIATGAFGTLFQEFFLRHFTHGAPPKTPPPAGAPSH